MKFKKINIQYHFNLKYSIKFNAKIFNCIEITIFNYIQFQAIQLYSKL